MPALMPRVENDLLASVPVGPGSVPANGIAPRPTWADAAQYNANAYQGFVERQNALPPQSWADIAGMFANGLLMGSTAPGMRAPGFRAYHGSPHSFERFDASKIGTGEGAQAYGHGLYLAENEGIARGYRDALATTKTPEEAAAAYLHELGGDRNAAIALMTDHAQGGLGATAEEAANLRGGLQLLKSGADIQPKAPGHMYEVQVNADPAHFLDWDRPLAEQSPLVQDKIRNLQSRKMLPQGWTAEDMATLKGRDLLQELRHASGSEAKSAALLAEAVPGAGQGIPGIRYLDAGSRGAGEGTSNHVIFDAQTLEILRKYGIAGLIGGGTAAGATQ